MKKIILPALFILLSLSACKVSRYQMASYVPEKWSYSRTAHYTMWSKVSTVNAAAICGSADNVAMVEDVVNDGQAWLRLITFNIYAPVTTRVYCKVPQNTRYQARQPHYVGM